MTDGETAQDRADRLAEVATELAVRIRDETPEVNGAWLRTALPDPEDWFGLAFVLASAVPDNVPWSELTAWARAPLRMLRPHGTHAAAQRHRYHGEPLCDVCRAAERIRDRERKATSRRRVA